MILFLMLLLHRKDSNHLSLVCSFKHLLLHSTTVQTLIISQFVGLLLYVHRNRRFIRDGIPGCRFIRDGIPGCRFIRDGIPGCRFIRDGIPGCRFIRDGIPGCRFIRDGIPGCPPRLSHSS